MKRFTFMTVLVACSMIFAQQELYIADGSSSGIYKVAFDQLNRVIASDPEAASQIALKEVASHGALDNIRAVINNEADCAFAHADVPAYLKKTENLSNIKTLISLFNEDVHFVVKNQPYTYGGGAMGMGAKTKTFVTLSDLEGFTIGASGGGWVTANMVRLQSGVAFKVQRFESGKDVMAALNAGSIVAAVYVGAAPLPNISQLPANQYKILKIEGSALEALKGIYKTSSVTYSNLNSGVPVRTVSVECLLLARVKSTPKFSNALKILRTNFCDKLSELQETRGTHKAWQQVNCENHGSWDWYTFPATASKK